MSADLLPPGSGPATAGYAQIWDSWSLYGPAIATIKNYGISITPDDWVPWFIWDYGLEDVVPYVRDYRRVLVEGPAWQRTRGTPTGISIGIGWVGTTGAVAASDQRHNWWEFQVGFTSPASDIEQIRQLHGVIGLSKASEDELIRMFSPGHDFRPVRMDMHRADDGLMDGYSGEVLWDGGPLVSFGWAGATETSFSNQLFSDVQTTITYEGCWFSGPRMDEDRFGGVFDALLEVSLVVETTDETLVFTSSWPTAWPTVWSTATEALLGITPLEVAWFDIETPFENGLETGGQLQVSDEGTLISAIEAGLIIERSAQTNAFAIDVWPNIWPAGWTSAADAHLEATPLETL